MIHGLMVAAAIDAAAPTDADVKASTPDSFGRAGSVVLGDIVAARTGGSLSHPSMGSTHMISAGWLSFGSTRAGDDGSVRVVIAEPSFDVFVTNGFSLGAALGGGIGRWEYGGVPANEAWYVTAMPRIGETIALTRDISMWLRFAAGVSLNDGMGQNRLGTAFRATFDVPFVFQMTRHVALQAGPQLTYFNQLAGPPDVRGFVGGASAGLSIVL